MICLKDLLQDGEVLCRQGYRYSLFVNDDNTTVNIIGHGKTATVRFDILEKHFNLKGFCEHGYGPCIAPDTECPHWIGTFCELDKH